MRIGVKDDVYLISIKIVPKSVNNECRYKISRTNRCR